MTDPFYSSKAWRELRHTRLKMDDYHCTKCGCRCLGKKRGEPSPHVDHIKDRRNHPELQLDIDNLRTLCESCHNQRSRFQQMDKPITGPDGYPLEPLPEPTGRMPGRFK